MAVTTIIGRFLNLLRSNPYVTDQEAAEILGSTPKTCETYRTRLINQGLLQKNTDKSYSVIEPVEAPPSYKHQIYTEMIETYLGDFRAQTTFNDRIIVGREIRLLLEKL